jgi:ElaB/YqjD/DUF883 family membrane-anchored ribosome-binding protein
MDETEGRTEYKDREACRGGTLSTLSRYQSTTETYMPQNTAALNDEPEDEQSLGEKLTDSAGQVKDKVAVLGRTAADKVDEKRDAAASGLQKAASALHEKAESLPGGEKVTSMAHAAADRMSSTAYYVREHDVDGMMNDVEALVKANPGRSLVAAAVVGFLLGRTFRSN